MSRDIARGAGAFGIYRAFELCAFFERKVSSDHVGLNGRCRADVHAVGRDVSFEIPIDSDFTCRHGGVYARSRSRHESMTFEIDSAFEKTIDHHVFTCGELSLYRQGRATVHGLYFHSVLIISAS
jgi:hypothetical protein